MPSSHNLSATRAYAPYRASLVLIAGLNAGCEPPAPADLGPEAPLPAAAFCLPPYPRFANQWVRWADLDRGRSCSVFLEQDECIVGVFRDCTAGDVDVREWRGAVNTQSGGGAMITLESLHTDEVRAAPRRPKCCQGSLQLSAESFWGQLQCQLRTCDSHDESHAGIYFELETPAQPAGFAVGRDSLAAIPIAAEGQVALLSGLGPAVDGVWRITFPIEKLLELPEGRLMAGVGSQTFWAAAQDLLVDPLGGQHPLPGEPRILAASTATAVVVVDDTLLQFTLDEEAPVASRTRPTIDIAEVVVSDAHQVFLLLHTPPIIEVLGEELSTTASISYGRLIEGPPRHATWLNDRIAFVGRCHIADKNQRCLYTFEPTSGAIDRLGLPDGEDLGRPVFGSNNTWWVPDTSGLIHVVEPEPLRPLLGARFELPASINWLTRLSGRQWLAISRSERSVWTVDRMSAM